ncbi:MAG: guanylate cyclase [Saprospiraceae bacterium]|nr:guanylate cyclase [Saprospiraceae bacterium]
MYRKLSAIMFTDMVGYTALMGQDEQLAKSRRKRHRKVLEASTRDFAGEIIQYFGDGSLITFDSALQAVESAILIQKELSSEPKIPLRIGIHTGDIAFDEDGVYGEGVNIASRIESMGLPESILISDKVNSEIQNHPELQTTYLGEFNLKNVKRPVKIFAVTGHNLLVPKPGDLQGKGELSLKTIAVLPFTNMSSDPDNEFFSDGITEEILNTLVRMDGLRVTSRTSSFAFKGKTHGIKQIAQILGVQSILEGSVRRLGKQVRITAQLINAVEDVHLWSETYDRNLEDIFAVQDEIAQKISAKMRLFLDPFDSENIKPPTQNMQAYDLYLKGVFFFNKFNPTDGFKALSYFDKALALEPDFTLPLSHKASIYAFLGSIGVVPPKEAFETSREAADRAIALNPEDASAHVAKALVALFYEWNWPGVEYHLNCASKQSKQDDNYLITKSLYVSAMGKSDIAVDLLADSLSLDPLNALLHCYYGQALLYSGSLDEALLAYDKALVIAPDLRIAMEAKGIAYLLKEEYSAALAYLLEYQTLTGSPLSGWTPVGFVYGLMGQREKVLEILDKLKQRQKENPQQLLHLDFATIFLALDDKDSALSYLEGAYQHRLGSMVFLGINPTWAKLHREPRFIELIKKVGIPFNP